MGRPIIICPSCLNWSAGPDDITNRWCQHCHGVTDGRVVVIEPDTAGSLIAAAMTARSAYAIELHVAQILATTADHRAILRAVAAGLIATEVDHTRDTIVSALLALVTFLDGQEGGP